MRIKDLEALDEGPLKARLKKQVGQESTPPAGGRETQLRHKYGAVRTERDGFRFASKAEARRYDELVLLRAGGEVVFFLMQVPFHLPGNVRYVCDFQIFWADGRVSFEDVKGMVTATFRAKMRLLKQHYPMVDIELVK